MTKVDEIMELVFDYADQRKYGRVGAANSNPVRSAIESLVKDAERFNFLCDCENEQALDLLANHVGQREDLIELVDELIKDAS